MFFPPPPAPATPVALFIQRSKFDVQRSTFAFAFSISTPHPEVFPLWAPIPFDEYSP
jgi:hypothetical protein